MDASIKCECCGKEIRGYAHYYCDQCYKKIIKSDIIKGILWVAGWAAAKTAFRNTGIHIGFSPAVILTVLTVGPGICFLTRNKGNFVKGLQDISSQFKNISDVQILYNKSCEYVIIKKDSEVLTYINKSIKDDDFNSVLNDAVIAYCFDSNMSFSKQFIIADSDSDFRQHNLSMIYNGDNSVKLKTSLSEYSPNQPLNVFINNLEIGSIPNTDLKYFQKPNYNPQISKVNISVSTNTDNIKTYKATVTVNFTVIKKTVIKKPAVRVNQNAVSLVECPKCKTLNSFSSTNCTLCNTPLFIEDINKTEQNEQNK